MDARPTPAIDREQQLDEAVACYLQAVADGQAPDRQEYLARHPDLAPELASYLSTRDRVDRWAASFRMAAQSMTATQADTAIIGTTHLPQPEPPSCVGNYEIHGEIARGGMGVVYKARQKRAGRWVALKMIHTGAWVSQTDVQRFRNEAEIIGRLDHPHIVPIYDVGECDGRLFFSMKLLEGGSLAQQVESGAWPVTSPDVNRRAARLMAAVAGAVHHAHQRGVLHRDLKPSNILLERQAAGVSPPVPYITDFGLARCLEIDSSLTQTGELVGTPSYMSPEQSRGRQREVTTSCDVYALGAVLYTLLAGRAPFRGETVLETLEMVKDREPAQPRTFNKLIHRDLETICLKAMAKSPSRRYATAGGLADDLRCWLQGEPIHARPVGAVERMAKWVRRHAAITALAASVLLVAALGLAGIVWKYLDAEEQKGIAQGKEQLAEQEADKATKARDFLLRILRISETDSLGGNITSRQVLADVEQRIPIEFADQPELRAELEKAIGEVKRRIARQAPQAMILEVRGTVQLRSAAGVPKAVVPQALLNLDDRLTLSADAQVQLVFVSDFHKERLKPGREVTINWTGCDPADSILERDDSVLMPFVRLPKATFYMGWDGTNKGVPMELTEDFELAVHDVTQGQWQAVMGHNPSWHSRGGGRRDNVRDVSDEELRLFPVEWVTWEDTQRFLQKLNERESDRGYVYRLPTEAEWEYACREGATSEEKCSYQFYIGQPSNDPTVAQTSFIGNAPWIEPPKGKYLGRPTRVGAYPPNRLGLYDLHGNVWQWCVGSAPGAKDRVIRGGCFNSPSIHYWQAVYRPDSAPVCDYDIGVRLVRVPVR